MITGGWLLSGCSSGSNPNRPPSASGRIEVLFLGHASNHHPSEQYAPKLAAALFKKGINISYTNNPEDLNEKNLAKYDGLLIYANHDSIEPAQERALLDFVAGGKGFIPVHCASFCFQNSPGYISLVSGQFKSHETGTFTAEIVNPEHPAMQGVKEFETWDETYVHHKLNADNQVLMERVDSSHREPWTWTRTYGKGRVFYTAYGHDGRTWDNPGFQALLGQGIKWAVGDEVNAQLARFGVPAPAYTEATIPNYEKRNPPPQFQAPLSPEASQKLMQLPIDFKVDLFASEPEVINPITMAWDERGRLWVVETVDYPNTVRDDQGSGDDRIKICEDTDGDGKADKFTVFADKLNIPTSLVFANGGVVVAQAPQFLFLKDTNGDDKADVRQAIIEGWGTFDTHAGPSNLRYGPDNQIWGTVGYAGFEGKVGGKDHKFSQGLYHFTPDGKNLEFLGKTSNNTWGLGFSETFDIFLSTANNTHSAYYSVPDRFFETVDGLSGQSIHKIESHYDMHALTQNLRQVDVHGGFTAAAGHSLYTARNFPQEYWNRIAFVCEPTGRLVHQAVLEPKGAGFVEKDGWNLIASADEWFGPVQAEVGPDGAVWVLDWYDFIIQHNPTPEGFENGKGNAYINPMRDRQRGRIYRIAHTNTRPYETVQLDRNDPKNLIAALNSDNMFWRTTAQRLLVESGNQEVLPKLYKIVQRRKEDEMGLNGPAIHALWTMHGLGALNGSNQEASQVAVGALKHPAAGVRKAAAQVLPKTAQSLRAILNANLLDDGDMHTRLAAMLLIARMPPSPEAGAAIYQASRQPENADDTWLPQAIFAAAATHEAGFLSAYNHAGNQTMDEGGLAQRIALRSSMRYYPLEDNGWVSPDRAPEVMGKDLTFTANVVRDNDTLAGTIMAQAGKAGGYGLYVENGKLSLTAQRNGKPVTITAPEPLPDKSSVTAKIAKDGAMTLSVDGKPVAEGKLPGQFGESRFEYGLHVGYDSWEKENQLLGKGRFAFTGKLSDVRMLVTAPDGQAPETKVDRRLTVKVVEHKMQFDQKTLTVKAGETVEITLENPDFMQHNLLILQSGSMEKVGAEADKLARDPQGADQHYVPQMPEVLASTKLVDPGNKVTLRFTAPKKPGDYPYVCTFPGHWRIMNGVMKVVAASRTTALK